MIESLILQLLLALPLVLGAYISIVLMKLPDLSIESSYVFGAVLAVSCSGMDGMPLFLIACIGGGLVGLVTSVLNQYLHVPFLLAAILCNGLFHGIVQGVLGTPLVAFASPESSLVMLGFSQLAAEAGSLAIVGSLLVMVIALILARQLGYCFAIYGNNPLFLERYGVSTRYVVITGVVLADAFAGLSGYLFAASNGFLDISMGYGVVLLCLTALILGRKMIPTQTPTVVVPLVGLGVYFALQQGLLTLGLDLKYFNAFQALIVLGTLLAFYRKLSARQKSDLLGVSS